MNPDQRSELELGRRRRRAFVLLVALAALAVATVLFGIWLRASLAAARTQRQQEQRLQAEWLAQSALQRAAAQLRLDRTYQGETWQVSRTELAGVGAGRVTIAIEPAAQPARRKINVRAQYPSDRPSSAAYSKSLTIDL